MACPLPPEGASVIVYGDTQHAAEMASRQGIRAADLRTGGTIDHVVPEGFGATRRDLAVTVCAEISAALRAVDRGSRSVLGARTVT
jgi:acetyl-CoA carboxylase alpha subunit